jgi:hypothetical protein
LATDQPLPLAAGWRAERLSTDPAWVAGSCASSPSTLLGNRYLVYAEYLHLVVFDLKEKTLRRMSIGSGGVGKLLAVDDHRVAMVSYDIRNTVMPLTTVVDVADDSYLVRSIAGRSTIGPNGSSSVRVIGGVPTFAQDSAAINGVRQAPDLNAAGEVVFLDSRGQAAARIFGWRHPSVHAWDDGHGYFEAVPDQQSVYPTPGVYDRKSASWDWLFPDDPTKGIIGNGGGWQVTLGTVAA